MPVSLSGTSLPEASLTSPPMRSATSSSCPRTSKDMKRAGVPHKYLAGKNIVLLFEKTSTRTRCAFEVAGNDLGMGVTYLDPGSSQMGKKESIEDTARVLGRMYDGIEYRGFDQAIVEDLAANAGVPGLERPDHRLPSHADDRRHADGRGELPAGSQGPGSWSSWATPRTTWRTPSMVVCSKLGLHFVACGPEGADAQRRARRHVPRDRR